MRAYFVLGVGLIILAAIAWYGSSHSASPTPAPPENGTSGSSAQENPMPTSEPFLLTSPAFLDGGAIPMKYTCDGQKFLSPPLVISGVPEGTQSLVLIMDDPDVPKELVPEGLFVHWVLYNIPPATREIPEGGTAGTPGGNSVDDLAYTGPCPPSQYEPSTHRYFFKLYALSGTLNFIKAPTKTEVEIAMREMVIGETRLIGTYSRT